MVLSVHRRVAAATRLVVCLTLSAVSLALATSARAQAVQYCVDGPCGVALVGSTGGVVDPHGEVTLKIGVGPLCTPLPDAEVMLDFSLCTPDIRVCRVQSGWPGPAGCPMLAGFTDGTGEITFRLMGGANNTSGAAPGYDGAACSGGCLVVRVNGAVARRLSVAAYDQNGNGGVNPADISVWLTDTFSNHYFARSDFDFNDAVSPADLSLLLDVSLDATSAQSCNLYCF